MHYPSLSSIIAMIFNHHIFHSELSSKKGVTSRPGPPRRPRLEVRAVKRAGGPRGHWWWSQADGKHHLMVGIHGYPPIFMELTTFFFGLKWCKVREIQDEVRETAWNGMSLYKDFWSREYGCREWFGEVSCNMLQQLETNLRTLRRP